jgi:predicted small secreted protein
MAPAADVGARFALLSKLNQGECLMTLRRVFTAVALVLLLLGASLVSGCNTVHGAGKDIERAGEVIQGE